MRIYNRWIIPSVLLATVLFCLYLIWWSSFDSQLIYTIETPAALTSVTFSPDGQLVATGDIDGQIQLRQVRDGALLEARHMHNGAVGAVAFSPKNQQLVSVGVDGTAQIWDVRRAAPPRLLVQEPLDPAQAFRVTMADGTQQISTEKFSSVAVSPDGQVVAIGTNENRILLVQAATGAVLQVFQGAVQGVFAPEVVQLVFSPDGRFLASKEALAGVSLWDIRRRGLIHAFNGSDPSVQSQVFSMGFSANRVSLFLVVHSTGLYDSWILPNGPYQIAANDQHVDEIVGVAGNAHVVRAAMSLDGTLAALGGGTLYDDFFTGIAHTIFGPRNDSRIFVYRSGEVKPIQILVGHRNNVSGVAFSPDTALVASVSADRTLRRWRLWSETK